MLAKDGVAVGSVASGSPMICASFSATAPGGSAAATASSGAEATPPASAVIWLEPLATCAVILPAASTLICAGVFERQAIGVSITRPCAS